MAGRLAALIGVLGAAALGLWWGGRKPKSGLVATQDLALIPASDGASETEINIDDDRAAEIIRRARPALERAREVSEDL